MLDVDVVYSLEPSPKSALRNGGLVEALEGVGERLLPARHLQKEFWADNGLPQVCTDGNDG